MAVYARPREEEGSWWDPIRAIGGLATMVIPGAQALTPYLAAGNMIADASRGNYAGMGLDATGMFNGGKGFNSNFNPQAYDGTAGIQNAIDNFDDSKLPWAQNLSQGFGQNFAQNTGQNFAQNWTNAGTQNQIFDGSRAFGSSPWNKKRV